LCAKQFGRQQAAVHSRHMCPTADHSRGVARQHLLYSGASNSTHMCRMCGVYGFETGDLAQLTCRAWCCVVGGQAISLRMWL
jgi:hypothetical protein